MKSNPYSVLKTSVAAMASLFVLMTAAAALADQSAQTPSTILEMKTTNGMGYVVTDVVIESDGTVTNSNWQSTTPKVINHLDASELATIKNAISEIQEGTLVRNPNEGYNPGGFVAEYTLIDTNGQPFVFAKNVSGVDFGLGDSQSTYLIGILQGLAYPPQGPTH